MYSVEEFCAFERECVPKLYILSDYINYIESICYIIKNNIFERTILTFEYDNLISTVKNYTHKTRLCCDTDQMNEWIESFKKHKITYDFVNNIDTNASIIIGDEIEPNEPCYNRIIMDVTLMFCGTEKAFSIITNVDLNDQEYEFNIMLQIAIKNQKQIIINNSFKFIFTGLLNKFITMLPDKYLEISSGTLADTIECSICLLDAPNKRYKKQDICDICVKEKHPYENILFKGPRILNIVYRATLYNVADYNVILIDKNNNKILFDPYDIIIINAQKDNDINTIEKYIASFPPNGAKKEFYMFYDNY